MSNQLIPQDTAVGTHHLESQGSNLLFTPKDTSFVRDVYRQTLSDTTILSGFPKLELDLRDDNSSGPNTFGTRMPARQTLEVATDPGKSEPNPMELDPLFKGEMDYLKNHPEIIEFYKNHGWHTKDHGDSDHNQGGTKLIVGPDGKLIAIDRKPAERAAEIMPEDLIGNGLTPEELQLRTYIDHTLKGMDLDPRTLAIANELADIYLGNDGAEMVKKLGELFKQHVDDPDFEKAVKALVEAGAWNGEMIPLKIWKDGSFVIGNMETGGIFFRKDGTSQVFEGHGLVRRI